MLTLHCLQELAEPDTLFVYHTAAFPKLGNQLSDDVHARSVLGRRSCFCQMQAAAKQVVQHQLFRQPVRYSAKHLSCTTLGFTLAYLLLWHISLVATVAKSM